MITILRIQYAFSAKNIKKLFESRKLLYQTTSPELGNDQFLRKIQGKGAYCGYDPTSNSLHLGNLVSIIMMGRLSLSGLRPIFLVGGATGMIGDPSGKSKERNLLDQQVIEKNIRSIQAEIGRIYLNIQSDLSKNRSEYELSSEEIENNLKNSFKIKNNYDFYRNMDAIKYLREVGKYFRMGVLLNRQTVANRLKSQQGISYAEFSYSIIQAYDFYRLFEEQKCILQFGGSDQWGNITNGCDLVRKKTNNEVYGITMPLLLTKSGSKFGKSQGNALFLNPEKTSLEQIHNYLLSTSDDEVEKYLRIFTFFSESKIAQIMKSHNIKKESRQAQIILSECVIRYLGDFKSKNKDYFTLSHEQLIANDKTFFAELFEIMKQNNNSYYQIQKSQAVKMLVLADFLHKSEFAKSKTQVRREVEKGGLYINNKKVQLSHLAEPFSQILQKNLIHQEFLVVRWGKKKYQFLHFIP